MKLTAFRSLSILILLTLYFNGAAAQTADFTAAQVKEASDPRYPRERNAGRGGEVSIDDGLVKLIYMVGKDGKPFEIMVAKTSMGKFADEAVKSINRNEYMPALRGDQPVESKFSSDLKFVFDEADLHGSRGNKGSISGARRFSLPDGFKSYYDQFTKELDQSKPDQTKLDQLLNTLSNIKHQSFYSLAYLSLARYRTAKKFDDKPAQMNALEDLIWFDDMVEAKHQVLQKDLKRTVYVALLQLQIESGNYAEALKNYSRFKESDRKVGDMFKNYISKIILLKESDQATQRVVTIGDSGYTHLPLLKRSFLVDVDQGELTSLKLRCDTKFKELEFKVDAQYTLPESWGECNLQVIGSSRTVATVLQK